MIFSLKYQQDLHAHALTDFCIPTSTNTYLPISILNSAVQSSSAMDDLMLKIKLILNIVVETFLILCISVSLKIIVSYILISKGYEPNLLQAL